MGTFFRRKKFIINPSFQLRSAVIGMIFLFVLTVAFAVSIFYPLQKQFRTANNLEDQLLISKEILLLHKRLWPGVLVAEILMGIFIIFTTHRIAGPLYRLEKTVQELTKGNYTVRARLRKTDELKELAALLNFLAESLETCRNQNEKLLRTCVGQLQDLNRMIARDGGAQPHVQEAINSVISKLERIPTAPGIPSSQEQECLN